MSGESRGSDHTGENSLTVADQTVVPQSLQGMCKCMTEVEDHPETALLLILFDHIRLDLCAISNQLDQFRIGWVGYLTATEQFFSGLYVHGDADSAIL